MLRTFGGDLYISVMTVINSVRSIAQTPVMAISDGASPIISYNYGARNFPRVREAIRFMTQLGFGYTMLIWTLLSAFPAFLFRYSTGMPRWWMPLCRPFIFIFSAL